MVNLNAGRPTTHDKASVEHIERILNVYLKEALVTLFVLGKAVSQTQTGLHVVHIIFTRVCSLYREIAKGPFLGTSLCLIRDIQLTL